MRLGLAALALAIMVVPTLAEGAWLQYGGDAAHAGRTNRGPPRDDVAWSGTMAGARAVYAPPLIVHGDVFVLLAEHEPYSNGFTENALYRLDLDSGDFTPFARFESPPVTFASDGERFFVTTRAGVTALSVADGDTLWTQDHEPLVPNPWRVYCRFLVVHEDALYEACVERGSQSGHAEVIPGSEGATQSALVVRARDKETGAVLWRWAHEPVPAPVGSGAEAGTTLLAYGELMGAAVTGPHVVVAGIASGGTGGVRAYAWAVDRAAGTLAWTQAADVPESLPVAGPQFAVLLTPAEPAGTDATVHVKLDDLREVNLARGDVLWRARLGEADAEADIAGAGFALTEDALFVASFQTIYRFNLPDHLNRWRVQVDDVENERFVSTHLVTDGTHVYAPAVRRPGTGLVYAYSADEGEVVWRHELAFNGTSYADLAYLMGVADGLMALASLDGRLVVLGEAGTSPTLRLDAPVAYPQPGDAVTVDASASTAAPGDAPAAYRLRWNGSAWSPWQPDPVFAHVFDAAGTFEAEVQMRTVENRSITRTITVSVGETRPTLLSRAFSPEYQEATFFTLGLALTAAGTAVGGWRVSRKRRLLQRELARVDAVSSAHADEPRELETLLTRHDAHAKDLLVAGRLTESHYALLRDRIAAARRHGRTRAVDAHFRFLPHGLALTLQDMLRDGRVNAWEREHVLRALDAEADLTDAQKRRVRALVDAWEDTDAADE